jgi:hypothetical protein
MVLSSATTRNNIPINDCLQGQTQKPKLAWLGSSEEVKNLKNIQTDGQTMDDRQLALFSAQMSCTKIFDFRNTLTYNNDM